MPAFRQLYPSFEAGGTIAPARIVKLSTSADRTVLQAGAGDATIGVSQRGQKRAPGLPGSDTTIAAEAGDELDVFGLGDVCKLTSGAAVARGDWIKSDASAKGIPATAGSSQFIVGRALQAAAGADLLFDVLVMPLQVTL